MSEQLALIGPATTARSAARDARRRARAAARATLAADRPVARVLVDTGLAHLDRTFDYSVPASLEEQAVPGARVKVRFAGRDLDGFVVERTDRADHDGRLQPLRRVVSSEPVLTPHLLAVAERLAAASAGTVGDVLRLAIPPRHATAEKALDRQEAGADTVSGAGDPPTARREGSAWEPYPAAGAFLGHVGSGGAPGASWLALPSVTDAARDWPAAFAEAALVAARAGRGSVLVVPDHRDLTRLEAAVRAVAGPSAYVRLTADQGPQARYTAFLRALRGHVRIAIGTRSAAFAPVGDLGLVAWWDDGDDLLDEPRAPYLPVRAVLRERAEVAGAAVLAGGFTRSVAVQQLVEDRVLVPLEAPRPVVRRAAPRV
ncbi:primosomal protein N' family DNA-binding protein, partial [Nostocoides japonicum]